MIAAFLSWCIEAVGKVLTAAKRIILYLLPFLFHFLLPFCTIIFTFTAPASDPKHSAPPCHLLLECRIPCQNELLLILPAEFCRKQLDIPAAKSLWMHDDFFARLFSASLHAKTLWTRVYSHMSRWMQPDRADPAADGPSIAITLHREGEHGEEGEEISRMWWKRGSARFGHAKCFGMCQPCG